MPGRVDLLSQQEGAGLLITLTACLGKGGDRNVKLGESAFIHVMHEKGQGTQEFAIYDVKVVKSSDTSHNSL